MTNHEAADCSCSRSDEHNVVRTMARTAQAMRRHLEKTVGDVPGGMSSWWILRYLHHSGPTPQADIASGIGVAESTLTRRLEQMEKDGLVSRSVDPTDKRRVLVELSEAGEALRAAQRQRADAEAARLVAGATAEDLAGFHRVIARIRENLITLGSEPDGRRGGRHMRSGFGPGGGRCHGGQGNCGGGLGDHGSPDA